MTTRDNLFAWIDTTLEAGRYRDYSPVGLQVEGSHTVTKIALGVSAHLELIERAAAWGAEALLVHHGFFWKGEPQIFRGWRKNRLKALLMHDISLGSYHLPLDGHPTLGNNAQIANLLGIPLEGRTPFAMAGGMPIGLVGRYETPQQIDAVMATLKAHFLPDPVAFLHGPAEVETVAIVSGGGAGYYEEARDNHGAQLFLTGEPREPTMAEAKETATHFVAAGHYMTEKVGIQALGQAISGEFDVEVKFFDIPNPV